MGIAACQQKHYTIGNCFSVNAGKEMGQRQHAEKQAESLVDLQWDMAKMTDRDCMHHLSLFGLALHRDHVQGGDAPGARQGYLPADL